jgi:SAM-dependent methyltransferase
VRQIACPMCDAQDFAPVCSKSRNGATYCCVRCTSCGFFYVNPEPDETELTALYDAGYSDGHQLIWHGFEDRLNAQVLELLRVRDVRSLVDLGAGQGRFVRMAMDAGIAADGVEPSTVNCAAALLRYDVALRPFTVRQFLDTHPRDLECVTLLNVLEHLSQPRKVLRDVAAAVRPGGVLAVVVPNVDFTLFLGGLRRVARFRDVYMVESERFTQQGFDPPVHLSSFSARHLRHAVEDAGFRIDVLRQAAVIRTANPVLNVAKRSVAAVGRGVELVTRGRVVWGYSLLCVALRHP